MYAEEWNLETALEVREREAWEDGIEVGIERGREEERVGFFKNLVVQKGFSQDEALEFIGVPVADYARYKSYL